MLASIRDLRDSLNHEVSDGRGYAALKAASAAIRAACGWPIERTEETRRVHAERGGPIFLPTLHLVEVTSITVAGVPLSPAGYAWTDDGRVFGALPGARWSVTGHSPTVLAISFRHGYDPVPDEVRAACVDLAVARVNAPDASQVVQAQTETIGSYAHSLTYGSATVDPSLDPRLAPYRLPPVVA